MSSFQVKNGSLLRRENGSSVSSVRRTGTIRQHLFSLKIRMIEHSTVFMNPMFSVDDGERTITNLLTD
jgi:hypothetical protein